MAYPNRSDLNEAAPSKQYGSRAAQERSMAAVPVAPPPSSGGLLPPATGGGAQLLPFDRPTERPHEPLTSGLSQGPGPGPEVLAMQRPDVLVMGLASLNQITNPDPDTKRLIDQLQATIGNRNAP